MASKKRKPWNADLVMPGLLDEPATVVKPSPETVTVGHSTGAHAPLANAAKPTHDLPMATRTLKKAPADYDSWRWSVEIDGGKDVCRYRLHRDGRLIVSGSIEALDGAHRAQLADSHLGETPQDLGELHAAWQWALACCRELMLALDGEVPWVPWPDPNHGWGEPPAPNERP
jgi:hypothetical protein